MGKVRIVERRKLDKNTTMYVTSSPIEYIFREGFWGFVAIMILISLFG